MVVKKKRKKKGIPEPLAHAVSAIMEQGYTRDQAYAIATKQFQRYGLLKKGTHDLTEKGKRKLAKHYKEPKKERLKKINKALKHKIKKLPSRRRKKK